MTSEDTEDLLGSRWIFPLCHTGQSLGCCPPLQEGFVLEGGQPSIREAQVLSGPPPAPKIWGRWGGEECGEEEFLFY